MASASTRVRRSLAFWLPLLLMACSKVPRTEPGAKPAPAKTYTREIHGKKLDLVFHADPLPNLIYQLDCMAGRHPCSKAAYEALWREELALNDEDLRELSAFRALRETFQGRLEVRGPPYAPSPLP